MNGKTGSPVFGIDQRPPRPKSLRELYEFVVKTCPSAEHNEEGFVRSIITILESKGIRTYTLKSEVVNKKLDLVFEQSWPLNDFWDAAEKYLKNLGVQETEIKKLWAVVRDGFI
ncbi:MAG: hypothetical protein AAB902_01255 [Patescibacteria group bacterium]